MPRSARQVLNSSLRSVKRAVANFSMIMFGSGCDEF
jgi:hypothetical protein